MRWLSRVVTVAVIITALVLGFSLLRTKMPATHVGGHLRVFAMFRDGSRLATGSPVMIAGVRIGEVTDLTVQGTFARVDMILRDDSKIPLDSWITKRAESAFGDSYLEIIPGGGEEGAAPVVLLKDGDQIVHVIEGGSTDTVLRSIARTMPKIDRGLDAVHDFALDGRQWVSGPMEDRLTGADRWLQEGHVEKPLDAADKGMERFESGTTRAADAVHGADVKGALDRFDNSVTRARKQMADIKTGIKDGLTNAREGMDRVDPTLDEMQDYLVAINEQKGTRFQQGFGKLVNDPELGETLYDLSETGRDAAAGLQPFKSYVGLRGEVGIFAREPRAYVTAELYGHHDTFYVIEGEKSGEGAFPEDQISEVPSTNLYNRYQVIREGIRFTFQFGKRFGPLAVRGGIKSSTVGIGGDILLGGNRLKLSADAFGGFTATPRVKLSAAIQVFHSIYVMGGVDDIFTKPTYLPIEIGNTNVPTYFESVRYGRDYFLGASLQFSEVELATILRIYGAMIIGLLL